MIRFDAVSISRGGQDLLSGASLQVGAREKVAISGPSGCGKTSLLLAILGAFPLRSGQILFQGKPVSPVTLQHVRSAIAFIGQEPILGTERVREALLLPFSFRANRGAKPDEKRLRETLERVHLTADILDKRCAVVSGGEKQRLAVARALLLGKRVFLADEVTSALDAVSKAAVMEVLTEADVTLLAVTHDPDWLARFQRRFVITQGVIKVDSDGVGSEE